MDIVLNTFGTSISRDNDAFVVSCQNGKRRIPTDHIQTIQIHKGTQITSDAVLLAIEKEIEILFIDNIGYPKGRIWSPKFGSISTIRKGQLEFIRSKEAVEWTKGIITRKISNQQAILLVFCNGSTEQVLNKAVANMEDTKKRIQKLQGVFVSDIANRLRGYEGTCSVIYFSALDEVLPEDIRFHGRSQHYASNPCNAFLNYAYGILYGKVESSLIKAGIDPYLGILHADQYNRPVLVYDVIEQYRMWVDYVVVNLVRQKIITDEMYSINDLNEVWLEGLGKRILIQSINDYFEDIVTIKGVTRSRNTHIELYAQRLAQIFKRYSSV